MSDSDLHSRSRLAGYEPEILFNAIVLIVGAGALGQNLALDLALAGVGELEIVDFDTFEAHNATRSPLYPSTVEQQRWGMEKAVVAAQKLLPMMTAPAPKIRYAAVPIQALGELPILRADLVYSTVDNLTARAYLAERCRLLHRPLIEGGFRAETMNLTVFDTSGDDPCYRCLNPKKTGAFSCTQYALQAEAAQIIPAIQNTATTLAGLQAETGILWLHGERHMSNRAVYANIRAMTMHLVEISRDPECPGIHWQQFNDPLRLEVTANEPVAQVLKAVEQVTGPAKIRFPDPLVVRITCTRCGSAVNAAVPEWRWLLSPLCSACGGPFSHAREEASVQAPADVSIESKEYLHTSEEHALTRLTCKQLGLPAGAVFEVWPDTPRAEFGEFYLMQLQGTIDQLMKEVAR